jgi:hypothetical protein
MESQSLPLLSQKEETYDGRSGHRLQSEQNICSVSPLVHQQSKIPYRHATCGAASERFERSHHLLDAIQVNSDTVDQYPLVGLKSILQVKGMTSYPNMCHSEGLNGNIATIQAAMELALEMGGMEMVWVLLVWKGKARVRDSPTYHYLVVLLSNYNHTSCCGFCISES